jgi:hypothetical protein
MFAQQFQMSVVEIQIPHFVTISFEPIVYFGLSEVFKNLKLLKFSTPGSWHLHTPLRVHE